MGRRSIALVVIILLVPSPEEADAHVKWFYDGARPELDPSAVIEPLRLLAIMSVVGVVGALALLQRSLAGGSLIPGPAAFGAGPRGRMAIYGAIPALLGAHLAVPLFVNGVTAHLFSVDNGLSSGWAYVLGLAQVGIALSLFYGGLTRAASVLLAAIWIVGVGVVGIEPMLENAIVLGFAAFFFCAGRGPLAVDRLLFPRFEPSIRLMRLAVPALRVGVGVSLAVAAFTEKLANPELARRFLEQRDLNFSGALGLGVSDDLFAAGAGSLELFVGLCLIAGVFPSEVVVLAWFPTNLSLTVFDWIELVGHLPIYGAMALILIWGRSDDDHELWIRGLREGPLAIATHPLPADEGTL